MWLTRFKHLLLHTKGESAITTFPKTRGNLQKRERKRNLSITKHKAWTFWSALFFSIALLEGRLGLLPIVRELLNEIYQVARLKLTHWEEYSPERRLRRKRAAWCYKVLGSRGRRSTSDCQSFEGPRCFQSCVVLQRIDEPLDIRWDIRQTVHWLQWFGSVSCIRRPANYPLGDAHHVNDFKTINGCVSA